MARGVSVRGAGETAIWEGRAFLLGEFKVDEGVGGSFEFESGESGKVLNLRLVGVATAAALSFVSSISRFVQPTPTSLCLFVDFPPFPPMSS